MKTTQPAPVRAETVNRFTRESGVRVTPLARAALQNGVKFEDVHAYTSHVLKGRRSNELATLIYEDLFAPVHAEATILETDEFVADIALDAALAKSVLAEGTIEHARLWWLGVL